MITRFCWYLLHSQPFITLWVCTTFALIAVAEINLLGIIIIFVMLLQHLLLCLCLRVSAFKDTNKMTLQNLATVFGPNLLRPAIKEEKKTPGEMFIAGAQEAVTQVAILQHLLSLRAKSPLLHQSWEQSYVSTCDFLRSTTLLHLRDIVDFSLDGFICFLSYFTLVWL